MFVVLSDLSSWRATDLSNSYPLHRLIREICFPVMHACSRKPCHAIIAIPAALMLMLCVAPAQAQKIDQNSNGMSDIWEQIHGATALDPNADSDGDGVPNRLEALAGTDPFDRNSFPKIEVS